MVLPPPRLRCGPPAFGGRGWAGAPALTAGGAAPLGFGAAVVRAIAYPETTIAASAISQARKLAAVAA
jgi:hypothetical protein